MSCAAAPRLQTLQGCFKEAERPVANLAGFEFVRCPITYQTAQGIMIARLGQSGCLEALNAIQRWHLPARRLAALEYVSFLLKLKAANGD